MIPTYPDPDLLPLDPKYFVEFLQANVDNKTLTDAEFREIIRNTLPLYVQKKEEQ